MICMLQSVTTAWSHTLRFVTAFIPSANHSPCRTDLGNERALNFGHVCATLPLNYIDSTPLRIHELSPSLKLLTLPMLCWVFLRPVFSFPCCCWVLSKDKFDAPPPPPPTPPPPGPIMLEQSIPKYSYLCTTLRYAEGYQAYSIPYGSFLNKLDSHAAGPQDIPWFTELTRTSCVSTQQWKDIIQCGSYHMPCQKLVRTPSSPQNGSQDIWWGQTAFFGCWVSGCQNTP